MTDNPRVSFGMIVLNGEPFLPYNLRALYPFAYQIIIVEGACLGAESNATKEGHSTDRTLQVLNDFKQNEDPLGKLVIVTRDGFWSEKDEQSAAYAKLAKGEYLWQIDVDEFYQPGDMQKILDLLKSAPTITAASFQQITFWGGLDFVVDGWYLRRGASIYRRLFKWGEGYSYVTHRPPTVHDASNRDLFLINPLNGADLAKQNIFLYHYSLVFPKQVADKCEYYSNAAWAQRDRARLWAQESFHQLKHPYRVHNIYDHPSWLERFQGTHPPQIQAMAQDIETGSLKVELRTNDDANKLVDSLGYRLGRFVLKISDGPAHLLERIKPFCLRWVDRGAHPLRTLKRGVAKILQ